MYSTSAGRKDLSIDTHNRVIGSMESEICMKMLSNLNETKFCASRSVYSMVKIIHLNDAFSQFFELKASPVQSQSLQQKDKKRRKGKCKKIEKKLKA